MVAQDSCALWPPAPVRAPRAVSRCALRMINFILHSYNYGTLQIVTGPWREQKSDLGVLKEVAGYALRDPVSS